MIKIINASKHFLGVKSLDNLSLEFKVGDKCAILGANGAGKSTLVRAIMGFYTLDSGQILINAKEIKKHRKELLNDFAFVPQTPPPLALSVKDLIDFAKEAANLNEEFFNEALNAFEFDLKTHDKKPFKLLSGGLKAKLLNSLALGRQSKVLILDEPYASLDMKAREEFYSLLAKSKSKIMLFITHREDEIRPLINARLSLELGKIKTFDRNIKG